MGRGGRSERERSSTEGERLAARAVEPREQGPPSGHDRTRGGEGARVDSVLAAQTWVCTHRRPLGASEMLGS